MQTKITPEDWKPENANIKTLGRFISDGFQHLAEGFTFLFGSIFILNVILFKWLGRVKNKEKEKEE